MSYSYFDKDNNIKKFDVQVGMNWDDIRSEHEELNSVFNNIDDGDGVVQYNEKLKLDDFLKQADNQIESTANNNIIEKEELEHFDANDAKLIRTFDKNSYSLENIKKAFPEDKYKIYSSFSGITVNDNSGKTVLKVLYTEKNTTVKEFNSNGGMYEVEIKGNDSYIQHLGNTQDNKSIDSYNQFVESELVITDEEDVDEFVKKLQNPEMINLDTMRILDNMSSKMLMNTISFNFEKNKTYILDEFAKSPNIPDEIKNDFIKRATEKMEKELGYKKQLTIENSRIDNVYYQSKDSFDVKFDNDIITVKKRSSNDSNEQTQEYIIDLNRLLSHVQVDLRAGIKAAIQKMPGETLMDLAIETDFFNPVTNREDIAGLFDIEEDRISVGYNSLKVKPETIIHELGHAIDTRAIGNAKGMSDILYKFPWDAEKNDKITSNFDYAKAYTRAEFNFLGLDKYIKNPDKKSWSLDEKALIKDGYMDQRGFWTNKFKSLRKKAYIFSTPVEGASELYLMAMTGQKTSASDSVVSSGLMQKYLELLAKTREVAPEKRHAKQTEF